MVRVSSDLLVSVKTTLRDGLLELEETLSRVCRGWDTSVRTVVGVGEFRFNCVGSRYTSVRILLFIV